MRRRARARPGRQAAAERNDVMRALRRLLDAQTGRGADGRDCNAVLVQ